MAKILVIHGPNLNLLGTREPGVYGDDTLADINARLVAQAQDGKHELVSFQSNAEHELVDRIHAAKQDSIAFILINPGAFTHTSISLRDALLGVAIPFIEIHLSNVFSRESFRHKSYLSDIAVGCITGLGSLGYQLALESAMDRVED